MRYYIATRIEKAKDHNYVRDRLAEYGWELTYDWTTHGSVKSTTVGKLKSVAQAEVEGVLEAQVVLALLPGGFGTHTELGLAIASNKITIAHSVDKTLFEANESTCAFYHHDNVHQLVCPLDNIASLIATPARELFKEDEVIEA